VEVKNSTYQIIPPDELLANFLEHLLYISTGFRAHSVLDISPDVLP